MTGHFKKGQTCSLRVMKEVRIAESKTKTKSATACWWKLQGWRTCGCHRRQQRQRLRGGVKRWHYAGGDATHGSMFHRAPAYRRQFVPVSRVEEYAFSGSHGNAQVTAKFEK